MAEADVAEGACEANLMSEFEFNPAAPEFVPQHQPQDGQTSDDWVNGTQGRKRQAAISRPGLVDSKRQPTRRATNAPEAPAQVSTLVLKNLSMDLEKADIMKFLDDHGAAAAEVELHLDSSGAFRGTAFARYTSPGKARGALDKLGASPEFGGRRARVEIQKSKALFGRKCLEAGLPQEELGVVREAIECFVKDPSCTEVGLPAGLNPQQRKYAHSLAERHNLVHATRQGDCGGKFVYLSKARGDPPTGRKKAHSFANCIGSRQSGGGKLRQHALSDENFTCDRPPGVEFACFSEPGEFLNEDAIVTPEMIAAPWMTPSPVVCPAPGLPLPPGLELEGLILQGGLPPPALGLPPEAIDDADLSMGEEVAFEGRRGLGARRLLLTPGEAPGEQRA